MVREMKGGIGLGKGHEKKRGSKRKIERKGDGASQ